MHLDVATLGAMDSFVYAFAGVVLFIAWSQNRKISALALGAFRHGHRRRRPFPDAGIRVGSAAWVDARRHRAGTRTWLGVEGRADFRRQAGAAYPRAPGSGGRRA